MYSVEFREEGRGPKTVRKFRTLLEVQTYVRDRWQGVEYMDSPISFHTDYTAYMLRGCKLQDLGEHGGAYGTDAYWHWTWLPLEARQSVLTGDSGQSLIESTLLLSFAFLLAVVFIPGLLDPLLGILDALVRALSGSANCTSALPCVGPPLV